MALCLSTSCGCIIYGLLPVDQLWLCWTVFMALCLWTSFGCREFPLVWGWFFLHSPEGIPYNEADFSSHEVSFWDNPAVATSKTSSIICWVLSSKWDDVISSKEILLWGSRFISCSIGCNSWFLPWPIEFLSFQITEIPGHKNKEKFLPCARLKIAI